jgi:hypothetical protein
MSGWKLTITFGALVSACGRLAPISSNDGGALPSDSSSIIDSGVDGHGGQDARALDGPDVMDGLDAARCNPATCAGCCNAQDTCILNVTLLECGSFGGACAACPAGAICRGTCVTVQPDCGPENCSGCCQGNDCASGISGNACGHGGEQCIAPCGPYCVPNPGGGGTCQVPEICGPGNCTGCCVGSVCAVGTQDNGCGSGGELCVDCTDRTTPHHCEAGVCVGPDD